MEPDPGFVECGYCDRRFVLEGGPADKPALGRRGGAKRHRAYICWMTLLHRPSAIPIETARWTPTRPSASAARHLTHCDDGELYLQYSASEAFGFDDGRLKTADYNTASGFGLRGVAGETTAFAHANEISAAAIDRAAATLKLLDPAKGQPAPPRNAPTAMYTADDPLSAIPFAEKVALCQKIDAAARARDPRVAQVAVSLAASWSVIDIVRAERLRRARHPAARST